MEISSFTTTSRRIGAIACLTAVLAACGSGGGGDDVDNAAKGGNVPLRQTTPVITGSPPVTVSPGTKYDFTPTATDADGDALSFAAENVPAWAAFDTTTGRLYGIPVNADIGLTSGIVLSVSDGVNMRSLPAFDLRVVDGGLLNTAPQISGQPPDAVVAGNSYSFTPQAVDADGNPLVFTVSNLPDWLDFDPDTGALTGTPTSADAGDYPNIAISVSDGNALDTLGPFDVAVLRAEVPVVLEARATEPSNYQWNTLAEAKLVYVDRTYTFSSVPDRFAGLQYLLTANNDKREAGNPFIHFEVNARVVVYVGYDARASELPQWLQSWTETGESWQTTDTTLEVYTREFDVGNVDLGDNGGAESMYSVVIEAQDSSLPAAADDAAQTQQDMPVSVDVLSNDSGLDATPLQLYIVTPPANGTATPTDVSTVYYVPAEGFLGTDSFDYAVVDASGGSAIATVTVSVTPASQGSTPSSFDDSYDLLQDTTLTMNVLDNDTGLFDAPLVVTVVSPAASGLLTVVSGNAIVYTPDAGFAGDDAFTYRVTDADGDFDVAAVSITVLSVNAAPAISGVPATTVVAGDSYSFVPAVIDADGDSLTYTIDNKPAWAAFDPDTGSLTGTPQVADAGITSGIVISVSDGEAIAALEPFTITVVQGNIAPTISGVPATTVVAGDSYSFVPAVTDADDDSLTFTIDNKPAWATFDPDTGSLTGTPQVADVGTTSGVVVTVSDGEAFAALDPFTITVVQSASGSATITWDPPTQSADGGPLNDLAGYRIYYGTSPGSYSGQVDVTNPGLSSAVVDNLAPGTWYFVTTAYDTASNESVYSNVASKTIP